MRYGWIGTMLVMLPLAAFAAEPVQEADHVSVQPRLMPLDNARAGLVQAKRATNATRSDRAAMNNGFMRIDRGRMAPSMNRVVPIAPAAEQRASRNGPLIIRGASAKNAAMANAMPVVPTSANSSADPVLRLFDGEGAVPTTSFRDSLRAGRTASAGRAGAHSWPIASNVKQEITSGFGMRDNPFSKGDREFHEGVDIAAAEGTAVLASADGTVVDVGNEGGYGKTIRVAHADGTESRYSHLSAQGVRIGQHVARGQKIAEVGSTGRSTGPHLDYRLTKNGDFVNPMSVLGAPSAVPAKAVASAPRMRAPMSSRQIFVRTVN